MPLTPNPRVASATRPTAREWLALAAQIELVAPADLTADELARVEDAAAEWVFQRSLLRALSADARYA